MFGKKEQGILTQSSPDKIDTIIGKNTIIEGTIKTEETIRIDGSLKGDIICNGNLFIGESAEILGNIKAKNITIAGKVEGNVNSQGQLIITNSGRLKGDIEVTNLSIEDGAFFEGTCKMISKEQ